MECEHRRHRFIRNLVHRRRFLCGDVALRFAEEEVTRARVGVGLHRDHRIAEDDALRHNPAVFRRHCGIVGGEVSPGGKAANKAALHVERVLRGVGLQPLHGGGNVRRRVGVLGGLAGAMIPFDMTGVDFALTALFAVLSIDQIQKFVKERKVEHAGN